MFLPEQESESAAWTITVLTGVLVVGIPSLLVLLWRDDAAAAMTDFRVGLAVIGLLMALGLLLPFLFGLIAPTRLWGAPMVAAAVQLAVGAANNWISWTSLNGTGVFEHSGSRMGAVLAVMMTVTTIMGALFAGALALGGAAIREKIRQGTPATDAQSPSGGAPPEPPTFREVK